MSRMKIHTLKQLEIYNCTELANYHEEMRRLLPETYLNVASFYHVLSIFL